MPSDTLTGAIERASTTDVEQRPTGVVGVLNSPELVKQISESLPRTIDPGAFTRHAITLVKQTPKLMECEAASVAQCIVRGAALGLDPDPALGHMWLVPRKVKVSQGGRDVWADVATFQVGYRGHLELAMRTGRFAKIEVKPVHRNDHFQARLGSQGGLDHQPDWFGDRGPVIGWYAYALQKDGTESFEVLSVADAQRHRDQFGPKKRDGQVYGPWIDHFDAMAQKTVFLKLAKWLPKSVEQAGAMESDGQAILAPVGAPVRPADVIEAQHTPDEPGPALAAGEREAPASDVAPGPAIEVEVGETATIEGDGTGGPLPPADEDGQPIEATAGEPEPEAAEELPVDPSYDDRKRRRMGALTTKAWPDADTRTRETNRKGVLMAITSGRTDSMKQLALGDWNDAFDALEQIANGDLEVFRGLKGDADWQLRVVTGKARTEQAS